MLLAVHVYAIGQPGAERHHVGFTSVYMILAAGVVGGVPHRRPVQPVRLVRDDAHRELRAAHPRRPPRTGARRHDVRGHQPAGVDAVHHRARLHLLGDRHGEHGRSRRQVRRPAHRTAPGVRRAARRRVRRQGRDVPAVLWLPDSYPTAPRPGHRGVRRAAHQGRHLRPHPHADPVLPGRLPPGHGAARRRRAHDAGRHPRRHRPGRPQADPVVQHREPHRVHGDGPGAVQRRRPRRGDLLHGPPHRHDDDAVPRRRADRVPRREHADEPARRDGAHGADRRGAVPRAGAEPRRRAAAVGVRPQARPRPGRLRIARERRGRRSASSSACSPCSR